MRFSIVRGATSSKLGRPLRAAASGLVVRVGRVFAARREAHLARLSRILRGGRTLLSGDFDAPREANLLDEKLQEVEQRIGRWRPDRFWDFQVKRNYF